MERFVQAIVGGGLAFVAGLWLVRLTPTASVAWGVGISLVVLGLGGLGWGIVSELD